jgi:hypothetical protein
MGCASSRTRGAAPSEQRTPHLCHEEKQFSEWRRCNVTNHTPAGRRNAQPGGRRRCQCGDPGAAAAAMQCAVAAAAAAPPSTAVGTAAYGHTRACCCRSVDRTLWLRGTGRCRHGACTLDGSANGGHGSTAARSALGVAGALRGLQMVAARCGVSHLGATLSSCWLMGGGPQGTLPCLPQALLMGQQVRTRARAARRSSECCLLPA